MTLGIFKKASTAVAEVAASEETASAVETVTAPEGLAEVIDLLAASVAALEERVGDSQPDARGGPQWPACWALMRCACRLMEMHPDDRLTPILETLARLFARTSPLPDGETLPRILKRLGLENRGEFSHEAAVIVRCLDLPAHSEFGHQAETLRDAQRRQEIWLAEREAEAIQRQLDEEHAKDRRLAELRSRIAHLQAEAS
jgi:hypothetical protein